MLEMNKQKQQEFKGFVGWLVTEMEAKVEDLSPKMKVQEYTSCSSMSCGRTQEEQTKAEGLRSGSQGAAGEAATGVRCVPGEAAAADGANQSDVAALSKRTFSEVRFFQGYSISIPEFLACYLA
jgi:hypothetical protein